MNSFEKIKHALGCEWYIQGVSANPLYFSLAGGSVMYLHEKLGYGYTTLLLNVKNGYGEVGYLVDDLKIVWKAIQLRLDRDHHYLAGVRREYDRQFTVHITRFTGISQEDLHVVSESELFSLLHSGVHAMIDSVGVAHIIESIGVEAETVFKQQLFRELGEIPEREKNECYAVLTTPSESSFTLVEEYALGQIGQLSHKAQERALVAHAQKYFWLQNSYLGSRLSSVEFFRDRMSECASVRFPDKNSIHAKKRSIIERYNLSSELEGMVDLIDFTTAWQDERKSNIYRAIGYLDGVLFELARRMSVSKESLYVISLKELFDLHLYDDVKQVVRDVLDREQGVFFVYEDGEIFEIRGSQYDQLALEHQHTLSELESHQRLTGSVANRGTAIGRVSVCKDILSLDRVKQGDVLVTSMTRPEYLPAIKRASAIVTDEGGVTCHAAIVSRELGIPAVIGTKIATKILKDGMTVEVRGNHGFVNILDSNS